MNIKVNYLDLPNEKYDYRDTIFIKFIVLKNFENSIKKIEDKGGFLLNQFNKRKNCINNYYNETNKLNNELNYVVIEKSKILE